jgi:hypothetical protein
MANKEIAGVIGYFDEPGALVEAAHKVRSAGVKDFDAFTPYPVHGLESAHGLERSPLPFVTFAAGIVGCVSGFSLQYWTSAVSWPLIVGGKPFNSWPAFIPITFEATILFAGLATAAGMIIINGLPNITRRAFDPKLTRDRFALLIESKKGEPFNETEAQATLKKFGAKDVQTVYNEGWF